MEALGHEVVDTVFDDFAPGAPALKYLARSLEAMADVEGVCFLIGWAHTRGCRIEHTAAQMYGKFVLDFDSGAL
jgi:hypothetical protein